MFVGIALMLLGVLCLAALVDLVAGGAAHEPSVLGLSIPLDGPDQLLALAGTLGVVAGAALAGGIGLLVADRRGPRQGRTRVLDDGELRSRETVGRLLEERVEMLSETVRELEQRQAELRGGAPVGANSKSDRTVVLPDAPSD